MKYILKCDGCDLEQEFDAIAPLWKVGFHHMLYAVMQREYHVIFIE